MGHLVISGTGRAGTTFLVEWFRACTLDVGSFGEGDYHPAIRAGYERRLTATGLPYVVKDPWLHTYCDDVDPALVEALVIPIRDLADAANARILIERDALSKTSAISAYTAGGSFVMLETTDVARHLAVGFYRLVEWATMNQVRTVFVSFPRIVVDAEYCVDVLGEFVPDRGRALTAHTAIADY